MANSQRDLMWLRVRKLLALATDFFFLRAFLRGRVAPAIEHRAVLAQLPFDFVADVGANRGQFSLICRRLNPRANIVAFEPLAEPARAYQRVFAGDQRVRLHQCALGPERGNVSMYVSARDDSSSLLPISEKQTDSFPGTQTVETRLVPVGPLSDFIMPSDFGACNLLKMDVQGFELQVLISAESVLEKFDWVYAECSFAVLYEGQALAAEIVSHLETRGFRFKGQFNPSFGRDGDLMQADFLFENAARGTGPALPSDIDHAALQIGKL